MVILVFTASSCLTFALSDANIELMLMFLLRQDLFHGQRPTHISLTTIAMRQAQNGEPRTTRACLTLLRHFCGTGGVVPEGAAQERQKGARSGGGGRLNGHGRGKVVHRCRQQQHLQQRRWRRRWQQQHEVGHNVQSVGPLNSPSSTPNATEPVSDCFAIFAWAINTAAATEYQRLQRKHLCWVHIERRLPPPIPRVQVLTLNLNLNPNLLRFKRSCPCGPSFLRLFVRF